MKTKEEIREEAIKILVRTFRGTISGAMGIGKTAIGLHDMNVDDIALGGGGKYIVFAPKRSIFQSWKDDACKFKLEHLLPKITFSTYLSLHKQSLDYTTIYLDELHSLKASHEPWLSKFEGRIIGLTGTPPTRGERLRLMQKYAPIVYTYQVDEAVEDKILNDYRIIVHKLPLDTRQNLKVKGRKGDFYTSEQKSYDYWSYRVDAAVFESDRMKAAIGRMSAMKGFQSKVEFARALSKTIEEQHVIFTNTKKQAKDLSQHRYFSGYAKSEKDLKSFKEGKARVLSCVLQLNEGVNLRVPQSIILHCYGNPYKVSQRIGRGLRLGLNEVHTCHILMYSSTVDESWVAKALKSFDSSKISYQTC